MAVVNYVLPIGGNPYAPWVSHSLPRILGWVLVMVPFGVVAGYVWGRWMWRSLERRNWGISPGDGTSSSRPAV
jgi:hypothetical protein